MKTGNRHWLFILIAATLLIGFSGCRKEKVYRIGVSQCSQDDWRSKMNEEIERETMFHDDAVVEVRSADDNNEKQIADIRYFADNGFDIIIAAPNEADAITPVIEEVYNKGIPVIIFDRDINGDSYTARIAADNHGIGVSAANYATSLLKTTGQPATAIEIRGLMGSTPAVERARGFDQTFTANGGTILGTGIGNWNQPDAERVADSLLSLYPNVSLIYAHNDRMAIGASKVARSKGLNNIKIIGIDAAPEIGTQAVADSIIDATFLYPTEGHLLIQTAMNILRGEPYQKETTLPKSSAVDLSNADIILLQNQSLRQETDKMKSLKLKIDEYWSKHSAQTSLFYAAIAILILVLLLLFALLNAYWQRKSHQKQLMEQNRLLEEQSEKQKELNRQLQEAIRSKLAFYTNVSHDLRTPLTLIAEPVSQLAEADNLTARQQNLARLADKNVKILRRLINQILDFRKYENGKLQLNLTEVDFGQAAEEWVESFREIARKRDIKLTLDAPAEKELRMAIDAEKMERIFFNLIANAIKFTPDNGSIRVSYEKKGDNLLLKVADTGKGISQEEIGHIFERFYQVDKISPTGSGIGLSLVKAFTELHGGEITVESEVGKGSVFCISIPIRHVADTATAATRLISEADILAELAPISPAADAPANSSASGSSTTVAEAEAEAKDAPEGAPSDKPLLLVIDDNADIRALVNQLLSNEYEIHEAENGKEGLAKAARFVPDLIICDIMMPVMDGLECCRRIKAEISTSHIPVLMLTACSMDEQRVEGYDSGADGYVSKPFNGEVLRARCRNLIANRRRINDLWQSQSKLQQPAAPAAPARPESAPAPAAANAVVAETKDLDNEFYARFLQLFFAEISNPDLNIEQIASKMGLGHSQFYRKIKSLTNYTPVELMRQLRLKQARQLLTTTSKSISEIAYEVGFSSPAYFTKCYRQAFGETPSDLRDNLGQ
jgi:signal transduction histidine kinase/DNA-binding response OmpR family regulator/ABC-type uncharacterized transport system substrate-binding protein